MSLRGGAGGRSANRIPYKWAKEQHREAYRRFREKPKGRAHIRLTPKPRTGETTDGTA